MTTENLPPEVWLRIFRLLHRSDVLNICLVNRKFLSIATSPVLWREASLSRKKLGKRRSCEEFAKIDRFRSTKFVTLSSDGSDFMGLHINSRLEKHDTEQTEEVLKNYLEICVVSESIRRMRIRTLNLKQLQPEIFVHIVNKLVSVDLSRSRLTEAQIIKIFEAIPSSKTLKSLNLSGIILSSIPPAFFVPIGESLEEFNFSHTLLTKEQSTNLLKGIAKAKKMRTLKIADIKFGLLGLEGNEFGMAIPETTEVMDLSNTQISQPALQSLFSKILEYQSMQSLNLSNINLGQVNSRILKSSLALIPHLVLSGCLIDKSETLVNILEEIKTRKKVTSLDLGLNNLSSIDENLLVATFSSMKQLDLSQTSLTKQQTMALLFSLSKSPELEELNLNDNDISQVDTSVLGDLVNNVRQLDLTNTNLQPLQILDLITKGILATKLMELNLGYFKMSKSKRGFRISFSKQVVFHSAMRRLPRFLPFEHHGQVIQGVHGAGNNSKNSFLSANQINDIIGTMCQSGQIVEFRLCRIDLKEVPEDLLAAMVSTAKVLNISYTKLSTSQLSAIFKATQVADGLEELELKEENLKYVPTYQITASIPSLKKVSLDDCSNNNEETAHPKGAQDSLSDILLEGLSSNKMEYMNLGKVQLHTLTTGRYLTGSRLKKLELEQLFSTLMAQDSIKDISIETSDLSTISEDILAKSLAKMRCVDLSSTNLTSRQLSALFKLLKDSTELEELTLARNIMSHVPAEDLAKSLSRLKKVKLEYSYLHKGQCMQILNMAMDPLNDSLELLRFGTFGYGWMDGRVMSYNLPTELAELVGKAREAGKFKLEFLEFSRQVNRATEQE
eukprot:GFUD01022264.1.p1 GENE.GFUD01022264.1~~GFUD01022264.1.p1  ORF type:complete len:843 (-),score=156.45 GFUD01022264.1:136-2664(-)